MDYSALCTNCLRLLNQGPHVAFQHQGAWVVVRCGVPDKNDHSLQANFHRAELRALAQAQLAGNAQFQAFTAFGRGRSFTR